MHGACAKLAFVRRQSRLVEVEFDGQVADGDCGKFCRFPPTLPAHSAETSPPSGHYVCRVTTSHSHRPTRTIPSAPCGSISRICRSAVSRTQRCSDVPLQVVGASLSRGRHDVSAGVEHSLEQLREHAAQLADRLQAEQGDAGTARVGVGRQGSRPRSQVADMRGVARRAAAGARGAGRIDRRARAGTGRARGGRRSPRDGADAGSRGSAGRTRKPAGRANGRRRAARSRAERTRWRT